MSLIEEITNDPIGRGYASMTNLEIAESLNTINRSVKRTSISGSELLGLADAEEYPNLTDTQRDNWLALCGVDLINPWGSASQLVQNIWAGNPLTVAALVAARTETISRAQELNLGYINVADVTFATTGAY